MITRPLCQSFQKKIVLHSLILLLCCLGANTFGQTAIMDSLKLELKKVPNDTARCNVLYQMTDNEYDDSKWPAYNDELKKLVEANLAKNPAEKEKKFYLKYLAYTLKNWGDEEESAGNNEKAIAKYEESLKIRIDINDEAGVAVIYNKYGQLYSDLNDMKKAFDYYNKSLEIKNKIKDYKGMAITYNNIGVVYYKQGDIPKALENYERALKKMEEIKDQRGIAQLLFNIATVYVAQGDLSQGEEYSAKCLKIRQEIGDKDGIAQAYSNLSAVYMKQLKWDQAMDCNKKSLQIYEELNNKRGIASILNAMGTINLKKGNHDAALDCYNKSLKLREEFNQQDLIAFSLGNIGTTYLAMKKYDQALSYSLRSLKISKEIGLPENIRDVSHYLSLIYKAQNNYPKAYEMFELSTLMRDSIANESSKRATLKNQIKYQYDKKATADSVAFLKEQEIKEVQIAQQESELKAKRNVQYALFGGLILVIVFAGFIYNRYKVTQKQKGIIEEQKEIVEEKNREITDSITYAKRIQNAILPPTKLVKEYLADSFILYRPKDIVAGDFYWMEHNQDKILFAAADCTGHGVPGALVSVICNNGLNRSVREHGLTEPSKILDKTRKIVIQEFEKSEDDVKDGMDISLCSLSTSTNIIQWAGANNPLWIIRKNATEVEEIKANKQPIGKHLDAKPFVNHEIQLQKGDSIYTFTDGFQDQFGGEKGKKFKAAKLKELLISIKDHLMEKQKEVLLQALIAWQGNLDQVDDICVIGVRI